MAVSNGERESAPSSSECVRLHPSARVEQVYSQGAAPPLVVGGRWLPGRPERLGPWFGFAVEDWQVRGPACMSEPGRGSGLSVGLAPAQSA